MCACVEHGRYRRVATYLFGSAAEPSDVLRNLRPVVIVISHDPLHLVQPRVQHVILVACLRHTHVKIVKDAVQLLAHRCRIAQPDQQHNQSTSYNRPTVE